MPLIKIYYNEKLLVKNDLETLVQGLLKESIRIYDSNEDKVSIFTAPYGDYFASTVAAEIEVRATLAVYDKPGVDRDELRQKHITEYSTFLNRFIIEHQTQKGIVITITFEDWQVNWLPSADKK